MDDDARGMASKILCDLLNISKTDNAAGNTSTSAGRLAACSWAAVNINEFRAS